MAEPIEIRESGVQVLDTEVEEAEEDTEAVVVRTEEPVTIEVDSVHSIVSQHFVVMSIETENDEITQMLTGQEEIDEAGVFFSNEDGEVGTGFVQIEGGNIEDALNEFEEEHL